MDIALGVSQLIALLVLGAVFFPPVRKILIGVGVFLVGGVVLAVVITLGVLLIRRTERKASFGSTLESALELNDRADIESQRTLDSQTAPYTTLNVTPPYPATEEDADPSTIDDMVEQLRAIDWFQFEKLVALLYRELGYAVSRRGGANPDGGIDLILEKDGQRIAVQCKQWKTWNVGVKAVREFLGALTDSEISQGIFITLCGYTGDAKQLAEKHGIRIVNETELAAMLEQTGARFNREMLDILADTRKFCPKCEKEMVRRTATKGVGAGKQFWGCSAYPKCRFTMPV